MATDTLTSGSAPAWRTPGFKVFLIVVLTVAMAVPLFFIQLALSDREESAAGANADVAHGWGGTQIVAGPILILPYTREFSTAVEGNSVVSAERLNAVLLPENLAVDVKAKPGTRSRGIFEVPVYRATVKMHATFDKQAIAAALPQGATPLWNEARVAIRVSDSHGLADNVVLTANGHPVPFGAGVYADDARFPGIQAPLALSGPSDLVLDTVFDLRGSREFSLSPLGRRTTATIDSSWDSPSFFGAFLPTDREVTRDGFKASWTVPYLARGFGQSFATAASAMPLLEQPAFGARFYRPVDHYQLVERSLKYAILFVALAFLVFFVGETMSPKRLHPVQYALAGSAQVLFYLLLLSFSEHVGFLLAYLTAATATVALTTLYAVSALGSRMRAGVLGVVLGAIYAMLYFILNAEDYALLIGSVLLFAALASTMYLTRKINWYALTGAPA